MSEEEEYSREEEYYHDWLGDNKIWLKDHYISENEDAFSEYCKKKFKEEREK
jgi:hypothetical protein